MEQQQKRTHAVTEGKNVFTSSVNDNERDREICSTQSERVPKWKNKEASKKFCGSEEKVANFVCILRRSRSKLRTNEMSEIFGLFSSYLCEVHVWWHCCRLLVLPLRFDYGAEYFLHVFSLPTNLQSLSSM